MGEEVVEADLAGLPQWQLSAPAVDKKIVNVITLILPTVDNTKPQNSTSPTLQKR